MLQKIEAHVRPTRGPRGAHARPTPGRCTSTPFLSSATVRAARGARPAAWELRNSETKEGEKGRRMDERRGQASGSCHLITYPLAGNRKRGTVGVTHPLPSTNLKGGQRRCAEATRACDLRPRLAPATRTRDQRPRRELATRVRQSRWRPRPRRATCALAG